SELAFAAVGVGNDQAAVDRDAERFADAYVLVLLFVQVEKEAVRHHRRRGEDTELLLVQAVGKGLAGAWRAADADRRQLTRLELRFDLGRVGDHQPVHGIRVRQALQEVVWV